MSKWIHYEFKRFAPSRFGKMLIEWCTRNPPSFALEDMGFTVDSTRRSQFSFCNTGGSIFSLGITRRVPVSGFRLSSCKTTYGDFSQLQMARIVGSCKRL